MNDFLLAAKVTAVLFIACHSFFGNRNLGIQAVLGKVRITAERSSDGDDNKEHNTIMGILSGFTDAEKAELELLRNDQDTRVGAQNLPRKNEYERRERCNNFNLFEQLPVVALPSSDIGRILGVGGFGVIRQIENNTMREEFGDHYGSLVVKIFESRHISQKQLRKLAAPDTAPAAFDKLRIQYAMKKLRKIPDVSSLIGQEVWERLVINTIRPAPHVYGRYPMLVRRFLSASDFTCELLETIDVYVKLGMRKSPEAIACRRRNCIDEARKVFKDHFWSLGIASAIIHLEDDCHEYGLVMPQAFSDLMISAAPNTLTIVDKKEMESVPWYILTDYYVRRVLPSLIIEPCTRLHNVAELVHRDIKPANLLMMLSPTTYAESFKDMRHLQSHNRADLGGDVWRRESDHELTSVLSVYIGDFGLTKDLGAEHRYGGSTLYMPPEQEEVPRSYHEPLDPRLAYHNMVYRASIPPTDAYAVGITLAQLLALPNLVDAYWIHITCSGSTDTLGRQPLHGDLTDRNKIFWTRRLQQSFRACFTAGGAVWRMLGNAVPPEIKLLIGNLTIPWPELRTTLEHASFLADASTRLRGFLENIPQTSENPKGFNGLSGNRVLNGLCAMWRSPLTNRTEDIKRLVRHLISLTSGEAFSNLAILSLDPTQRPPKPEDSNGYGVKVKNIIFPRHEDVSATAKTIRMQLSVQRVWGDIRGSERIKSLYDLLGIYNDESLYRKVWVSQMKIINYQCLFQIDKDVFYVFLNSPWSPLPTPFILPEALDLITAEFKSHNDPTSREIVQLSDFLYAEVTDSWKKHYYITRWMHEQMWLAIREAYPDDTLDATPTLTADQLAKTCTEQVLEQTNDFMTIFDHTAKFPLVFYSESRLLSLAEKMLEKFRTQRRTRERLVFDVRKVINEIVTPMKCSKQRKYWGMALPLLYHTVSARLAAMGLFNAAWGVGAENREELYDITGFTILRFRQFVTKYAWLHAAQKARKERKSNNSSFVANYSLERAVEELGVRRTLAKDLLT